MNIKNSWLIWLMGGLLFGQMARAANIVDDGGIDEQYRLSATLEGALGKQVAWSLSQTLYFDRDFRVDTYAPQASLVWTTSKWFSMTAGYRAARVDGDDSIWIRQRLFGGATVKATVHDWQLSYRLRWQGDWRDPDEGGLRYRAYLRNQAQARYLGFEHVAPYLLAEVFHRLDSGRASSGVDRTLYRVGGEVEITSHQSVDLWARKRVNPGNDPEENLLGLEYAFTFNY